MRHILQVIDQILEIIPLDETALREALDLHHTANRYRAPEAQGWHDVAATLAAHCEGRDEPWVNETRTVWRNEN